MLEITNTAVTRDEEWHLFRRTHHARRRERYHGMLLQLDGKGCPELAPWLYRDEETMRAWIQAFHEAGRHGLERAPIPGRPARLTIEPRTQVTEAVRRCPRDWGDHASWWTTTWVRPFMSARLGSEYGRERVRQLLHALGVRRRRLRHPTVPVYGAVAPLPGRTHSPVSPTLRKEEFAPFLQHLWAYDPRKRLLVIHGRGEQHQGAPVGAAVHNARGRLVLKPQPAYSPERDPQERIWQWWRRVVTHHHWCATLRERIEALGHVFRYLAGVKDQVRQ